MLVFIISFTVLGVAVLSYGYGELYFLPVVSAISGIVGALVGVLYGNRKRNNS